MKSRLHSCIGCFLYQAMNSRGDALAHWQRNNHIVIDAEKLYNFPKAQKNDLIKALLKLIEVAEGAPNPRFRLDNEERVSEALEAIANARPWWSRVMKKKQAKPVEVKIIKQPSALIMKARKAAKDSRPVKC